MLDDNSLSPAETQHVADDVLAEYAARRLPELDELDIETHLAECAACTAIVRSTLLVDDVWAAWTAPAHGAAYLAERLADAVRGAQVTATDARWQARLGVWAERWAGRAEAAVRVVVDASGTASRVVTEGVQALGRPDPIWQFAPVPVAVPTRGPHVPGAPSTAGPNPTVALAAGATQARVAVGGARRDVVVRLDGQPADRPPPLVLLVALSGNAPARVAEPSTQSGVPYLIARFADLPDGDYLVAFEPLPG